MPDAAQYSKMDHHLPKHAGTHTIVPNRHLRARLLLAEARSEALSTRTLPLSRSGYRVSTASTRKEIFDLRLSTIQLVVLSDSLGCLGLRSLAEDVRRQWPLARILIIGAAQVALDDPLYDEAVERHISSADLLATLAKLSAYTLNRRIEVFRPNPGTVRHEEAFEQNRRSVPAESDPTKEPGYGPEAIPEPRDLATEEQRDWRAVLRSQCAQADGVKTPPSIRIHNHM